MCGIFAFINSHKDVSQLYRCMSNANSSLKLRGPDWYGSKIISTQGRSRTNSNDKKETHHHHHYNHGFVHTRLSIVNIQGGSQPIVYEDNEVKIILCINGEIFNHMDIRRLTSCVHKYQNENDNENELIQGGGSDCEAVLGLYRYACSQKMPPQEMMKLIDGEFAFVLFCIEKNAVTNDDSSNDSSSSNITTTMIVARDRLGVVPLYGVEIVAKKQELPQLLLSNKNDSNDRGNSSSNQLIENSFNDDLFHCSENNSFSACEDGTDALSSCGKNMFAFSSLAGTLVETIYNNSFYDIDLSVVREFPPGSIAIFKQQINGAMVPITSKPILYYEIPKHDILLEEAANLQLNNNTMDITTKSEETILYNNISSSSIDIVADNIRELLTSAVCKRLMADVPYGVLLSGGLDSSLVASIAAREIAPIQLNTFSIGLKNSPDLLAARVVAKYLNTHHTEFIYTIDEGICALADVIQSIESYDVTTIRASVPMNLLARRIRTTGTKMVLSGEGSDELFGGYLYFHMAPNSKEIASEIHRKVSSLHYYDLLRANKSMMAWGVEPRVPFLDPEFVDYVLTKVDPALKIPRNCPIQIEKYILRKAFEEGGYLPDEILWRQKEQFSDGVGYGWIDSLKRHAFNVFNDDRNAHLRNNYNNNSGIRNKPHTDEALLYRATFDQVFKFRLGHLLPENAASTIACSTPIALEWAGLGHQHKENGGSSSNGNVVADASGRSMKTIHLSTKNQQEK